VLAKIAEEFSLGVALPVFSAPFVFFLVGFPRVSGISVELLFGQPIRQR
jgi:hypothetical protein